MPAPGQAAARRAPPAVTSAAPQRRARPPGGRPYGRAAASAAARLIDGAPSNREPSPEAVGQSRWDWQRRGGAYRARRGPLPSCGQRGPGPAPAAAPRGQRSVSGGPAGVERAGPGRAVRGAAGRGRPPARGRFSRTGSGGEAPLGAGLPRAAAPRPLPGGTPPRSGAGGAGSARRGGLTERRGGGGVRQRPAPSVLLLRSPGAEVVAVRGAAGGAPPARRSRAPGPAAPRVGPAAGRRPCLALEQPSETRSSAQPAGRGSGATMTAGKGRWWWERSRAPCVSRGPWALGLPGWPPAARARRGLGAEILSAGPGTGCLSSAGNLSARVGLGNPSAWAGC